MKVPELVGRSGSMLLHFYSDVAYNMTGFNITFSVDACPTENTELTCSGHGTCDPSSGACSCDQDFKGTACSVPACPGNCGNGGTGTALISYHVVFDFDILCGGVGSCKRFSTERGGLSVARF